MSDNPTDAELVEAVAREVLEFNGTLSATGTVFQVFHVFGTEGTFDPFRNANDLMMVLERQVEWQILRDKDNRWCVIWRDGFMVGAAHDPNLAHAVLEAALKARRGECKA